jgi:hypothetical protein
LISFQRNQATKENTNNKANPAIKARIIDLCEYRKANSPTTTKGENPRAARIRNSFTDSGDGASSPLVFVEKEMPDPGMETVVLPREFQVSPRTPTDVLTPDLLRLSLMPGAIFIVLRKRKPMQLEG